MKRRDNLTICGENRIRELLEIEKKYKELEDWKNKILGLVNAQAEDEGLWCQAEYISEAMLQQALRYLHEVIENETQLEVVERLLGEHGSSENHGRDRSSASSAEGEVDAGS